MPKREALEREVRAEAGRTFAPEFLNRLDEVLVFHPLEQETLERITRQLLEQTGERLDKLEGKPGENWNGMVKSILAAIGSAIGGGLVVAIATMLIK